MRRALAVAAIALTVLVAGGAAADTFTVTLVSQTSSTITLGWSPQPGYGYLFSSGGVLRSRTNDPSRSSVKFSKVTPASYDIDVIVKGANGHYPVAPPPPPPDTQPPTAPGALTTSVVNQTAITIVWDAATDNVGVTNYRVYRNGTLIGQGPGSSGGVPNLWADSSLTCDTTYTYDVEAQDKAGNTGPRATLQVRTAACPPPPSGNVLEFTGTVPAATFLQQINAAPSGPLTVRPSAGQTTFTVNGGFTLARQNVTIQHAIMLGAIDVDSPASGFVIEDSQLRFINNQGADNWVLQRNLIDSQCLYAQNWLFGANNWKILNNDIRNYHLCSNESIHSEAFFIGGNTGNGLIQGNTFTDNGTTGQLFFSYFNSPASGPYPHDICVKGNTFIKSHNRYWHIDLRAELTSSLNISFDPDNVWTHATEVADPWVPADGSDRLANVDGNRQSWVRDC